MKARDKLTETQKQMGGEEKKLIRDVVTRWNSSYYMYQRLMEEYKAVNTTLCLFDNSKLCLSSAEVAIQDDAVQLLKHFEQATRELSADTFLSISKIIPLARSLQHLTATNMSHRPLKHELLASMAKRFTNIEANYTLAASTLLDPRFKKIAFGDNSSCQQTIQRITNEVASTISLGHQSSSVAPIVTSSSSQSVNSINLFNRFANVL